MRREKNNIRVFFAIDLPEVIKRDIQDIIRQLQTRYEKAPIKWVRTEHLHITLQFLESIKVTDIPNLMTNVRLALKDKRSIHIKLDGIELFPNAYKPRVISLKVDPQDLLADLSKSVGNGIIQSGYSVEKRPFKGHLTLGRIKDFRKPLMLDSFSPPPTPSFRANAIIFYQSEPSFDGSHYTPLDQIILSR